MNKDDTSHRQLLFQTFIGAFYSFPWVAQVIVYTAIFLPEYLVCMRLPSPPLFSFSFPPHSAMRETLMKYIDIAFDTQRQYCPGDLLKGWYQNELHL